MYPKCFPVMMDSGDDSLLARNQIPIIDLSYISTEAATAAGASAPNCCMTMKKISSQLGRCLEEKGIALLVNHGIPQHRLSSVYREVELFRKRCGAGIDSETYQCCSDEIMPHSASSSSLTPYPHYAECYKEEYHVLDVRWLNEKLSSLCDDSCGNGNLQGHSQHHHQHCRYQQLRNSLNSLTEDFRRVSIIILYALAMTLGDVVDANYFVNMHKNRESGGSDDENDVEQAIGALQILYSLRQGRENAMPDLVQFPKRENQCTFTLLAQDPDSNLELKVGENRWLRVGHLPGAILFHAGKLLENWTNGRYKYLQYRVMTPEETLLQMRSGYMTAFNVQPAEIENGNTLIDPLFIQLSQTTESSSQTKSSVKRYVALFAAIQHFQKRLKRTKICKLFHVTGGGTR